MALALTAKDKVLKIKCVVFSFLHRRNHGRSNFNTTTCRAEDIFCSSSKNNEGFNALVDCLIDLTRQMIDLHNDPS